MTRISGSVPDARSKTRPEVPNFEVISATADCRAVFVEISFLFTPETLTNTCGYRAINVAFSARDFPLLTISCIKWSAVKMPSPVCANCRIMMWPDCSPPNTKFSRCILSNTYRSPTAVVTTVIPNFSIARINPRLLITVPTTVECVRAPALCKELARMARMKSPSISLPK